MKGLYGTGVALVTPFNKIGKIDFKGLEKLVEYVTKNNVNYLVVLGTTAESVTLTEKEKLDVINCILSVNNNKIPLILGMGGYDTHDIIRKIKNMKNISYFYAILSVSPYYNNPSQNGIYEHYKSIVNNTKVNLIIYNVPKRTGSNIYPSIVTKLANNFKQIIGIKEASGNILQSYRIIESNISNFSVISGDDFITVPIILGGGTGVISVIAQCFPKQISEMVSFAMNNNVKKSFYIFYKIREIISLIYSEGNPTGIKTLLDIMGICSPYVRLPLIMGTRSLRKKIIDCLNKINL